MTPFSVLLAVRSAWCLNVARAAEFQVCFGDDEAVGGGGGHHFQAPTGVFTYGFFAHGEDAVALVGAAAHASARAAGGAAIGRKRSAFSITMTDALGTLTPTSMTVVATRMWASPEANRVICRSFRRVSCARGRRLPWKSLNRCEMNS